MLVSMTPRTLAARLRLAAAALALVAAIPAHGQQIGTVASVEPALRGTAPGAAPRDLGIGAPLVENETVQSSATGRAQILFADQSTLSIAPNTTIILDRFVFDPNGGGGMGLEVTQGALRFIGGSLSRAGAAEVTTPTATIGIRGSSALVLVVNGRTITIFLAGQELCITVGPETSCTSRQGGVLTEDGYQGVVSPAFLLQMLELIDGLPQGGGSNPGLGSGVDNPNPSARGPVSTGGEEFDFTIFDDELTFSEFWEFFGIEILEEDEEDDFCEIYPYDCYY